MKKIVPILITWDVDVIDDFKHEDNKHSLRIVNQLLESNDIKATFLFVAKTAHSFSQEIGMLIKSGHEIGCHGLAHDDSEEYNKMPQREQRVNLKQATTILQDITQKPIRTFRAPRVKTSHLTQGILENLGYHTDCSVSSQRIDFISSNWINPHWIFAPRLPYHPSPDSAFKKGNRNIWVVPISAMVMPFISSSLKAFRLGFVKFLFRRLYKESVRTGKPIVYLAHPFEFIHRKKNLKKRKYSLKVHGLLLRDKFYVNDPKRMLAMTKELFSYMKSFPEVKFYTVSQYHDEILTAKKK